METDEVVLDPLLSRPLLEALGINTRDILAAAAEKHSRIVDVKTLLNPKDDLNSNGRVFRIIEGLFQVNNGAYDVDLYDEDVWLNLGPKNSVIEEFTLKKKYRKDGNQESPGKELHHCKR